MEKTVIGEAHLPARREEPDPAWVRAACPCCGGPVVSNAYYVGGKGYILRWECWNSLGERPTCDYWRTL